MQIFRLTFLMLGAPEPSASRGAVPGRPRSLHQGRLRSISLGPGIAMFEPIWRLMGSFTGRGLIRRADFFNNPEANQSTAKSLSNGYAGSFHIFGHGGCLGDPGHCEVNEDNRDPYDLRNPHPLTPAKKRITVTEALREIAKTAQSVTVTVVPVVTAANELCDTEDVFRCRDMHFVTYNG